jgi:hypothetical protein
MWSGWMSCVSNCGILFGEMIGAWFKKKTNYQIMVVFSLGAAFLAGKCLFSLLPMDNSQLTFKQRRQAVTSTLLFALRFSSSSGQVSLVGMKSSTLLLLPCVSMTSVRLERQLVLLGLRDPSSPPFAPRKYIMQDAQTDMTNVKPVFILSSFPTAFLRPFQRKYRVR